MQQHISILALLIFPSHSWVLKTTHTQVTPSLTKDVTLECVYDYNNNGKPRIAEVLGIVIHIFHGSQKWGSYAKVRTGYQDAVLVSNVGPRVSVKGHAGTVNNSFLSITWSLASSNTTGKFACEINGYSNDDKVVDVVTDSVSIIESQLSFKHLLAIVLDEKEQSRKGRNQTTQLIGRIQESVETIREDLDSLENKVNGMQLKDKLQRFEKIWKPTARPIPKCTGSRHDPAYCQPQRIPPTTQHPSLCIGFRCDYPDYPDAPQNH